MPPPAPEEGKCPDKKMFGIGSTELLVILLVALIVLGPRSLAGFSSRLGRLIGEFRRVSTDFQRTLNLEAAREEAREAAAKKTGSSAAPSEAGKEPEKHVAPSGGDPGTDDLRQHGIPDDSPLAQALKRAREQAENGGKVIEKKEGDPMGPEGKATDKARVKQEENDIRV